MNPLIVALDSHDAEQVLAWAKTFGPHVGMVKIGMEAFYSHGPALVEAVRAHAKVFLDLKLHDIPNTVAHAAKVCSELGVSLLTVHASGGQAMIEAAVEHAPDTQVVAVTVLTSIDAPTLHQVGQGDEIATQVGNLADLAICARAAGIVCAPSDLQVVRKRIGDSPITVVPGIRPVGSAIGDQKRVATPAEALAAGATYLVVGRPITQSPEPMQVISQILKGA